MLRRAGPESWLRSLRGGVDLMDALDSGDVDSALRETPLCAVEAKIRVLDRRMGPMQRECNVPAHNLLGQDAAARRWGENVVAYRLGPGF
ncbi:hypothetical protein IU459_13755 [Nocardia amamiensis]|uniref:Uncharacterized protein n=1 Tax=Nocardia amamiensis TaxID=404578 RepID=A0ABS0CPM7_9NOCA|nr:hypothetical protein [Nocardia amamiensis]MBF6298598.1 hypothetical protein [Nocardia amamiensis]